MEGAAAWLREAIDVTDRVGLVATGAIWESFSISGWIDVVEVIADDYFEASRAHVRA